MQYKLLTLTLPTAAATSHLQLRGGPISQSSIITSYNHGISLPTPDKSCLAVFHSTSCQETLAKDGTECVWCDAPSGKDNGICLSEFDVVKAVELTSFRCPNYAEKKQQNEDQDAVEEEGAEDVDEASLIVASGLPDFSCFSNAWGAGDVELCKNAKATDGSSCLWCTAPDDLIEFGVCVSPSQAGSAGQFGLNCPSVELEETAEVALKETSQGGLPDINCFKAAWIADNAEQACAKTSANDGTSCVWCQTKGDTMGACVSSMEAGFANGQFGLSCPNNDQGEELEEEEDLEEEGGGDNLEDDLEDAKID